MKKRLLSLILCLTLLFCMIPVTAKAADPNVLPAPKSITLSSYGSGFKVSFAKVSGASGYRVQRKTGSKAWKTISVSVKTAKDKSLYFTDSGLSTGKSYRYRIRAYKKLSDGSKTYGTYKTSSAKTAVRRPTSFKASNTATGIKLSWKKVTGATGYILQRKTGSGKWSTIKTVSSGTNVSYTDTKRSEGTKYSYRVYAYYKKTSVKSAASETVIKYFMKQPAISSLTSPSAGKLTVKWTRDQKASGYEIQYSTASDFSNAKKATYTATESTAVKSISSLSQGKKYYVRIRSYITKGSKDYYSAWSEKKSAVTQKEKAPEPEPAPEPGNYSYIGNKNSKIFHKSTCVSVKRMNEENKVYFTITRDEIIGLGYEPCKNCNP